MKKIIVAMIFAFSVMLLTPNLSVFATTERIPVIIMFKERQNLELVRKLGGQINIVYRFQPAVAAVLPKQALDALSRNPAVEYVVPDLPIELVDQTLPWGVERIGAPAVHASGNKGTGINVAILDTGIDTDHPDLSYVYGYDFSGDNDPDPEDFDGHGTHVAGTVAALDNDIGVIGVAPEANLYILKIFTDDGSGSYSDAVEALEWCIGTYSDDVSGNEIQVISMSWGSKTQQGDPGIEPWINQAYDLGILLVGAAGNEGNPAGVGDNVIYPARYENVIAVAATDDTDTRAWWSSTGPAVELAAPGVSILSTYLDAGYTTMSGTSMACPHVSGTAALVLASTIDSNYDFDGDGVWDNDEVRKKLQDTADDLGETGRDNKYGYGLVDADEACGVEAPPPAEGKMHVGDISMWYVKRGPWYTVYTEVPILDENGQAVSDATVYLETTLPDGSIQSFSGTTGSDGTVTFSLRSKLTGTYTSTVIDVVKEGWIYDSASNIETSESLTVP
jgi:subtilisin family serine protease